MKTTIFLVFLAILGANSSQQPPKTPRIIGGETARAGQFPYIAAITISTGTGTYFCTGTLINSQWILTAGQCLVDAILFQIRLGSNHINNEDPNVLRLAADLSWIHPNFNPDTLDSDIGLIKLREPITFTDYISPISLLSSASLPGSAPVTTAGWGQVSDEDAGLVDELNYIELTTLSNEECRLTFGNQITDNMVCVAGNFNEGTCNGDLGSPLVQYAGCCLTFHVGLSSFISGNGCEAPDPSGFTRTHPYLDWITNTTNSN